jgi:hypothetical protein
MALPQATEYDEAIQNSRLSFLDAELQGAVNDGPVFMGVPGGPVASGNFAIVYRFRIGTRRIAIKCFTREKVDQQIRYTHIHQYLSANPTPWTIDFQYIKDGIRVKGKTFPILKMEWLDDATTLLSYINESIENNNPLDSICTQFYKMASDLRRNSIAHGDLQHGNLIVSRGDLRLIDYDCMCVPMTSGFTSDEDGLPDYQHPARRGGKLSASMDHFSILVIWTSLYALTLDPTLWNRWVREEERLLFCKKDFLDPSGSLLIHELRSIGDPRLRLAVDAVVNAALEKDPLRVPHLVDILSASSSDDQTPWWQAESSQPPDLLSLGTSRPHPLPEWIAPIGAPHVSTAPAIHSSPAVFSELSRGFVVYCVISVSSPVPALFVEFGSHFPFSGLAFLVADVLIFGFVFRAAFSRCPEVLKKAEAKQRLERAIRSHARVLDELHNQLAPHKLAVERYERSIAPSEKEIKELMSSIGTVDKKVAEQKNRLVQEHSVRKIRIEKEKNETIARANSDKDAAKMKYDREMQRIEHSIESEKSLFIVQSKQLSGEARKRHDQRMDAKIQAELEMIDFSTCPMMAEIVSELKRSGFRSLADFTGQIDVDRLRHRNGRLVKVKGIGVARAEQLVFWRKHVVASIVGRFPQILPTFTEREVALDIRTALETKERLRNWAIAKLEAEKLTMESEFQKAVEAAQSLESEAIALARMEIESLAADYQFFQSRVEEQASKETAALKCALWPLKSVVNPTRHLINAEEAKLKQIRLQMDPELKALDKLLVTSKSEFDRYSSITPFEYFKHVLRSLGLAFRN